MNKNTKARLKRLRKIDPEFFKHKPRKSQHPKVAAKRAEVKGEDF